ncbi:MFS transporter [Vagococcus elongatus]|uniref:MFS transporter n=1 Tax=Vagococcus elongatus TaxID=180344 RepID=A0A430B614_9ENTE|nr:MFS transporter [Vagococcus elongatus]RSU15749.1 MFS transporter [Vagococcus elongatus]
MNKLLTKLGMGEKIQKNFAAILFVAAGGSIIYGLPYFRYDYYDAYLQAYNLTNYQMGIFGSIFGIFGMISYFFGGYLADRVSIRWLLTLSLIGTGIGGFIHLLPLSFSMLVILYAFWGFTSLFAFWPSCVKAVRVLSDTGDQGKAFGFFEGGRGVTASIMASLAVVIFQIGVKMNSDIIGMKAIIIYYSIITILSGLLVFYKVRDQEAEESERISLKGLFQVLKMPAVWIIGIVTFCNYVFTLSVYYFVPYATSLLGATVTFGAGLAAVRRYLSPISNVGGGFLGDKLGTGNLLLTSFIVMAVGTLGILLLPLTSSAVFIFTLLYLIIYMFYQVNYSLTWAMMEEGKIPVQYSGTAAGIISTIGYLPEIFCSLLAGYLLDTFPGVSGYRYYFSFLIVMLLIGALFVLVWIKFLKKKGIKTGNRN